MLRVGLTGGLSSGKSTVARLLAKRGAVVFDADAIVRGLYDPGAAGSAAARELFGDAVVDAEGRVDRSRLAAIVFGEPEKRHALEAKIHPLVGQEILRRFEEAREAGADVAVAESSQLLEAKTESRYDRVALVIAPDSQRLLRWEAKGGDSEDARRRIAAQLSPAEAFDRADDVIVNDGTLEDLDEKVNALWNRWKIEGKMTAEGPLPT
jgi:dephospho-CoA kinase